MRLIIQCVEQGRWHPQCYDLAVSHDIQKIGAPGKGGFKVGGRPWIMYIGYATKQR